MKKRLSILLALSLLFSGLYVQPAAAASWSTGKVTAIADIAAVTLTRGNDSEVTFTVTLNSDTGTTAPAASGMTVTSANEDIATVAAGTFAGKTQNANTATGTFTITGVAAGETTVTLTINGIEATASVTVNEPSEPTATPTGFTGVATYGTAISDGTIYITFTDTETITQGDDVATFQTNTGLTVGQLTQGVVGISGTPTAIGNYSFTLTATGLGGSTTKTFTLTIKGEEPTLAVWGLKDADATEATERPYAENMQLGSLYDPTNNAYYVGKDVTKNAAQEASSTSPVSFVITGDNPGLDADCKISGSGHGLLVHKGDVTPVDEDDYHSTITLTLEGTATKAGDYTLTITPKNAETARAGSTKSYTFKITVSAKPSITAPAAAKKKITWGEAYTLEVKVANADGAFIATTVPTAGINTGETFVIDENNDLTGKGTNALATKTGFTVSGYADGVFKITGTWAPAQGNETLVNLEGTDPVEKKFTLIAYKGEIATAATDTDDPVLAAGTVYYPLAITVSFNGVAPTIYGPTGAAVDGKTVAETIEAALNTTNGRPYGTEITSTKIATAKGPGTVTWPVTDLNTALNAYGLEVDTTATTGVADDTETYSLQPQVDDTAELYVKGIPTTLTSSAGTALSISATNNVSTKAATAVKPKLIVTTTLTQPTLVTGTDGTGTADSATTAESIETVNALPEGNVRVNETFTDITTGGFANRTNITVNDPKHTPADTSSKAYEAAKDTNGNVVEFFAEPAPLTWTASDLPKGVKLYVDPDDTRFAYLYAPDGFTGGTDIEKDSSGNWVSPFTLTIKNANLSTATTLTGNLQVWDNPKVTTSSLANLTVDKTYKAKLAFTNTPVYYGIGWNASDNNLEETSSGSGKYRVIGSSATDGLTFDETNLVFTGTLDMYPKADRTLSLDVTPLNYYNTTSLTDSTTYTLDTDKAETKNFKLTVKGVTPKLEALGEITFDDSTTEQVIKITAGTLPVVLSASIPAATANKILNPTTPYTSAVPLTEDSEILGLTFTPGTNENGDYNGKGTLTFDGSPIALKSLPVTIEAGNYEKTVTKAYKVTVAGADPVWQDSEGTTIEEDQEITLIAGTAMTDTTYTVEAPYYYEIKTSPSNGTEKNGLKVTVTQPTSSAAGSVKISGTPTADKETKTQVAMTVTNLSTKQKAVRKITFVGKYAPTITSDSTKLTKEVLMGKKISIKPAVKGSKTITWSILDTGDIKTEDALNEYGLAFDTTKGAITGTPTKLTLDANNSKYEKKKVVIQARNDVGTAKATVTFGVKGAKTKITTKNITVKKNDETRDQLYITTNPAHNDGDTVKMTFNATGLPSSVTLDPNTGALTFDDSSFVSTKGTTATVTVDNAGTTATGKVKFVINDAKPEIDDVDIPDIDAQEKTKVTKTYTVSLTEGYTGSDTKIKWAIKTAPKRAQAKIKGSGATATLTITVPKGIYNTDKTDSTAIEQTVGITATNTKTKDVSDEKRLTFNINPCVQSDTATAEDAKFDQTADATAKEKAATGEGEVKLGKTRTAPTAAQLGAIQKVLGDGYVIAAVLPEIEVTAEGQYDFEVDLDEKVAEGAELVWFAFPESGKESEDDEIVDFYTKAGEDTKVVPEDHVLVVSPWLNAEVKYEPVIAVKVDAAEAEAVDAESVKEAAEEQAAE